MSLKTKILAIGVLLCLVTFVSIAGCLYTAPTVRNGSVNVTVTPIIATQTHTDTQKQPIEKPRASPDTTFVREAPRKYSIEWDQEHYKVTIPKATPTIQPSVAPSPSPSPVVIPTR